MHELPFSNGEIILLAQLGYALYRMATALLHRHPMKKLRGAPQLGGFSNAEARPGFDLPVLTGEWAGRGVEVHVRRLSVLRQVEFKVRRLLPGVSAAQIGGGTALRDRVLTGDPQLDDRLGITGEPLEVLRALTPEVRAALLALTEQGWQLVEGDAVLTLAWKTVESLPLAAMQEAITAFAAVVGGETPDLGARIAGESSPEVRFQLLAHLSKFGAPYVRRELKGGVPVAGDDRCGALAAALLGDGPAWERSSPEAQAEALRVAPEQVLTLHRARSDERALIAALDQVEATQLPGVVEALGAVGSRLAVAALRPVAERTVLDARLAQLAAKAITQIQARLVGAERGQITVLDAAPQAGSLALVEGAGRLSVAQG